MQLRETGRDGQSQAQAAKATLAADLLVVTLGKGIEDLGQLGLGQADPGVAYLDLQDVGPGGIKPRGDGDLASRWRELQGVAQQIPENLLQAHLVAMHERTGCFPPGRESEALAFKF